MVRQRLIGLFFLLVTFFPSRLLYSKTDFTTSAKLPARKIKLQFPVFTHQVAASVYFPDEAQTDASPLITADGSHINRNAVRQHRWMAVSRNLLKRWGGKLQYGDSLEISGISPELDGVYIVRDTMNKRLKNTIDLLVDRHDNIMGHWKNVRITKFETITVSN